MSDPPQDQSTTSTSSDASTMPKPQSLTLILAATPSLGIGKNGTLPWPQLKKEMGYFARVTKRVSSPPLGTTGSKRINAVIMGRKTWDSIPPKFRPLKDRLNIVVTRDAGKLEESLESKSEPEGPIIASGILDALKQLEHKPDVERIYVIGGASVYQTALELPQTTRVLLTKIHGEYECDTFFPVNLEESAVWRKVDKKKLESFTGEEVDESGVEEREVNFEFCLFERE
ncbi:hypothetical protein CC86DRAFT_375166 [Ophiobolus disseminans]|uniref:Dihydrofolate reductase n=1 Tax=Ophiobolus disseminans TaxID=1469910 RepID=A0A6A6ZEL0_9PLEO|nr:hypothetical protein CC86DRAFT_375166 [Ophiobolus disseminans]